MSPEDDGRGGNNWSYNTCKAPLKMSSPTNQHPVFKGPDALRRSTNSVRAVKAKHDIDQK